MGLAETGGGAGRGRYYRLTRSTYEALLDGLSYDVDLQLTQENAKARVLAALAHRPLTNADVREITQLGRNQVLWLMKGLREAGLVRLEKRGRASCWTLVSGTREIAECTQKR